MATTIVRLPGAAVAPLQHRHVTLKTGTQVLTLPITSPVVPHSNLAPDWVTIPRLGRDPLMRRGAVKQKQMALSVKFVNGGLTVEAQLLRLIVMAWALAPMSVAYGPFEGGVWWLTDLSLTSEQRALGTNAITEATAKLTFTFAPANSFKTTVTAAKPKPIAPTIKPVIGKAPVQPKSYIVKAGDTLTAISVRFYGDTRHIDAIAKANKIANPNRIYPGQKLILP